MVRESCVRGWWLDIVRLQFELGGWRAESFRRWEEAWQLVDVDPDMHQHQRQRQLEQQHPHHIPISTCVSIHALRRSTQLSPYAKPLRAGTRGVLTCVPAL